MRIGRYDEAIELYKKLLESDSKNTKYLENILQPYEELRVVIITVYKESIGASHQIPVESTEQGNLIGQQPIEVMLQVAR